MKSLHKTKLSLFQVFGIVMFFGVLAVSGCNGISTKSSSSGCATNTAQLYIYEGGMSRVCGCAEGTGFFSGSNSFNCTMSIGTTLYFTFIGLGSSNHQIRYQYGNTAVFNQSSSTNSAAFIMNQSGSFPFSDLNGIGGTFIITP
jgi:hypothetical protein